MRPNVSDQRPAAIRNAANTIVYEFSTHDSDLRLVSGKSVCSCGNAMFTMNTSSPAMNTPATTTIRTLHLRSMFILPSVSHGQVA